VRQAQAKLVLERAMSSDLWCRVGKHGTAGAIMAALRAEFLHVNAQQQCAVLLQLLLASCSGKSLGKLLLEVDDLHSTLLAADLREEAFVEKFLSLGFLSVLRRTFLEEWAAGKMRAAASSTVPSFRSLADDLRLVYFDDMQTKFEHVPGANMAQSGTHVCLGCGHVRGKTLPHDILDCHALEKEMAARKLEHASKPHQQSAKRSMANHASSSESFSSVCQQC
jgi:hypothetical protein